MKLVKVIRPMTQGIHGVPRVGSKLDLILMSSSWAWSPNVATLRWLLNNIHVAIENFLTWVFAGTLVYPGQHRLISLVIIVEYIVEISHMSRCVTWIWRVLRLVELWEALWKSGLARMPQKWQLFTLGTNQTFHTLCWRGGHIIQFASFHCSGDVAGGQDNISMSSQCQWVPLQ